MDSEEAYRKMIATKKVHRKAYAAFCAARNAYYRTVCSCSGGWLGCHDEGCVFTRRGMYGQIVPKEDEPVEILRNTRMPRMHEK